MAEIIAIFTREHAIEDGVLIRLEEYFSRSEFPHVLLEVLNILNRIGGKFELGELVITANAASTLKAADVLTALIRHQIGDWGELDKSDHYANEEALIRGGRLFSAYVLQSDLKFWIITECSREVTTVLLPEDY
jgi:hypothetical protein